MEGRQKNPPKVPENTWLLVVAAGWAWSTRILFKKEQNNKKKRWHPWGAAWIYHLENNQCLSDLGSRRQEKKWCGKPWAPSQPAPMAFWRDGAVEHRRRLKGRPKAHETSLVGGSQPRGSSPASPCLKRSGCQVFQALRGPASCPLPVKKGELRVQPAAAIACSPEWCQGHPELFWGGFCTFSKVHCGTSLLPWRNILVCSSFLALHHQHPNVHMSFSRGI